MRTLMVGPCAPENLYFLEDQSAALEVEFEAIAVRALSCVYPTYRCIVFGGSFRYGEAISRPDLALVARNMSHWFVIEAELLSHSLEKHVLPQIRTFTYGEPQPDCASILARELGIQVNQASTLVDRVPRDVVVIANGFDEGWELSLRAHRAQFLSLSFFTSADKREAFEIRGILEAGSESLGFGTYSAADRALRFPLRISLPLGPIRIEIADEGPGIWKVVRDDHALWVTKDVGIPFLQDQAVVQLLRATDGRIILRGSR